MNPDKRLHLSIASDDLVASKAFYAKLFDVEPVLEREGYVKFVVDEPALNLALVESTGEAGVQHLGVEVSSDAALAELSPDWANADPAFRVQTETVCCHHRSSKVWATDPSGVSWEGFVSYGVEPEDEPGTVDEKPLPVAPSPCC